MTRSTLGIVIVVALTLGNVSTRAQDQEAASEPELVPLSVEVTRASSVRAGRWGC